MTYDATVLGLSPSAYYDTTETSGTTLADSAGSADATLTGSHATLGATVFGLPAVEFTDADTYAAAAVGSLGVAGSIAYLMHVYDDTGNANVGYASAQTVSDTGARNLGRMFGSAAYDAEGVGPGGGASLPTGDYLLVGTQASGGAQSLYVNGVLSASSSYTPGAATGGELYFPLGVFDTGVGHVAIGKVAVFDGVVLSSDDVAALYAAALAGDGGGGGGGTPVTIGTRISWDGGLTLGTDGSATFDPPVDPGPTVTAPSGARIYALVVDSTTTTGARTVPTCRMVSRQLTRYRILVGGKDVTYFRGIRTPLPTYSLISPLRYGSGSITFPQINAALERAGHGELTWLRKFATVRVQRLADDGHVIATDYVGFLSEDPAESRDKTIALGGQATGLAAMQDRPEVPFPTVSDVGGQVMSTIQHALRQTVANSPTTGIQLLEAGGTGSHLDWLTEVLAKSTQLDGVQWTVEPNSSGAYHMHRKDLTTIDATVYVDGYRVNESLKRDYAEEPNRIWASGIDPDGKRIRFAIFPGLASGPRPAFPGTLSPGDSGSGVTALIWRLWTVGYLDQVPFGLDWTTDSDDPVTDAVKDLQDDAGITRTGTVNSATWAAVFDPDVTGYSLRRASIKPAAQRSYTQAFLRNASGQIIRPNPAYDRTRPPVDATLDMGPGFTRRQIQRWSQHELADDSSANWVGTITVTTGAVIDGEHNPGDALDPSQLRDVRSLKPGTNLWLANWDGGTLVHLSGVNVSPDGCELTVDTRARDTMKVWEVIARNRESRRNPSRQWIAQNRRSGIRDDTGTFYDGSVFGKVPRTFLPGDQWSVIPTPGGRSGTLQTIQLQTDDSQALYGMAIFGKQVGPGQLSHLIGNPLTKAGTKAWETKQKTLTDDHWLVYSAGGVDDFGSTQPCGYWPRHVHPNDFTASSQTGSADASSDTITITGHGYSNGTQVYFYDGSVPDGLTGGNNYYVVNRTTDTFQVSDTEGGSAMNITADASGVRVAVHTPVLPPVTGEFRDNAGVPYFCKNAPVLWLAIYPDRDCYLQGGRVLDLLLDDAAG